MNRGRRVLSLLAPLAVIGGLLSAPVDAHAAAAPSVTITWPTAGYLSDQIGYVYADGSVDPSETADPPQRFDLVVDGDVAHPVDSRGCQISLSPTSCEVQLFWGTDGHTGEHHTFQVIMTTESGRTAATPVKAFTVVTPYPTSVKVTAPHVAPGQTGLVPVTVTGTVNPAYGDAPRLLVLFHGDFQDPHQLIVDCPAAGAPTTCTVVFQVGAQDVATQGYFVLFGSYEVPNTLAAAAPVITMSAPANGTAVTGTTHVTATATVNTTDGDVAQSLALLVDGHQVGSSVPCSGAAEPFQPQTCDADFSWDTTGLAAGQHNVAVRVTTQQTEATSNVSTVQVAAVRPTVPISCVVPTDVNHGQPVTISCHAGLLAWHSVVALRITGGSIPHEVLFGKIDIHGNVSYPETFIHPNQLLTVRATTATTRLYTGSSSPSYPLHVH